MGRADAMREWIYQHVPGLGKAPEIKASKPEAVKQPEKKEQVPLAVEGGEKVIAKYRLKNEGGPAERQDSEDTVIADDETGLYAVADGVSSKGGGGEASRQAVATIKEVIGKGKREGMTDAEREDLMRQAIIQAGEEIKFFAGPTGSMNTTFSGFLVDRLPNDKRVATIGHVGDSRVYHYRAKEGTLIKQTVDDGITDVLAEAGIIPPEAAQAVDQSEDEGRDLPEFPIEGIIRSIDKALNRVDLRPDQLSKLHTAREYLQKKVESDASLGQVLYSVRNRIFDGVKPDKNTESYHHVQVKTIDVDDGDLLFAVSDGISDVLKEERIQTIVEEGLRDGKTPQEIFEAMAVEAAADQSKRQKGEKIKTSDGQSVKAGDDVGISGMRVLPLERREAAAPVEELSRRADDETPVERAVEVAYDDQEAAQLKSTIDEYENAKGGLELAEQAVEKYRGKLAEYGENPDNADFSKVALLKMNEADLSDLTQKYVGPDFSNKDLERMVKEAKLWARNQIGPKEKFKSVDELVKDFEGRIQKYKKNLSTAESSIGMYQRSVESLRPEAELAKINLLKAKAERPELIEDGDQVTMEFQGVPTRFEIRKVKGKDLFLEPIGKEMKIRPIISLDGSKGKAELAKLKEALRAEAEAAEEQIEKAQLDEARAIAK